MPRKRRNSTDRSASDSSLLVSALRDIAIKELGGSSVKTAEKFMDSVYGIPLTGNLPLQHILGVDVLALGRAMTLVGAAGSTKSSLGWYLAKLIREAGGMVVFIDTEQKTNPDQAKAIVDNDEAFKDILFTQVRTLEELLGLLKAFAMNYEKTVPARDVPVLFLVDSLNGITSDNTKKKLEEGEDVGYETARGIAKFQEFFKYFIPNHMERNPFLLTIINHRKKDIEQPKFGAATGHEPGGSHKDFMYTWRIELVPAGSTESVNGMSHVYKMKVLKSSLGPTYKHSLEVPYESEVDDAGNERIWYDWDVALTNLLSNDKISKTKLAEVMHFIRVGNKCSSKTLGLTEVTPKEMGQAIHNNPEIYRKLQDQVLRIRRKRVFGSPLQEEMQQEIPEGSTDE